MESSSSVVYDTVRVVSVVDSSFMAQIDSLVDSAFGGGVAGLASAGAAKSMGAIVRGFDTR